MSICRFGVSPVNFPDPDPEKQLFTRFSAHGSLYLAMLVNAQSAFQFEAV